MRRRSSTTNLRLAHVVAVLVLHSALVLWLTWPLGAHLTSDLANTRAPCGYDSLYMGWVLAHESHALTSDPRSFLDGNIFHPTRHALLYGDTGFGALPYFMPTFLLTGNPTLALNLLFLGGIVLTASSLHVAVAAWTASQPAGFVAAATFLGSRWVLWDFIPSAPSYAMLQYFPAILLLAARPVTSLRRALLLWLLVFLQCLTDVVYVASAVLPALALIAGLRLLGRSKRGTGLWLVAVVAGAALCLVPIYAAHLSLRAENPDLQTQTFWRAPAPAPTYLPWGPLTTGPAAVQPAAWLPIALGALAAFLRSVWTRRHAAPATPEVGARGASAARAGTAAAAVWPVVALWTAFGLIASCKPIAVWNGRWILLPQAYLARWLPQLRTLRVPSRLGVAALMGLAVLAGIGFAECARWLPAGNRGRARSLAVWAAAILLAGAMYSSYRDGSEPLPRSYPLAEPSGLRPGLATLLRASTGPLLELPVLGPAGGLAPELHAPAMYRSIFHWRPLLNGYSSYWPAGFLERMRLASRLPDLASGRPDSSLSPALAELHAKTGLESILVHLSELPPAQREQWLALAERAAGGLDLVGRDGDELVFAVRRP
ncbi:MAG TPA: hypothetical protein VEI94_09890 [Candidatus Bathyarchaeia archaeon]|nr:hypothetical protein [Candidatus Bathyarchaeia archaeon]